MKAVFAFDVLLYRDNQNQFYSKGLFPYLIWERYLKAFNDLTIISRTTDISDPDQMQTLNLSSGPGVEFCSVPNLSGVYDQFANRSKAVKIITSALSNADVLIARLPSDIGLLAIKIAKKLKKPWAVELVSCPWDTYWNHGSIKGKLYAPFVTNRVKRVVKSSKYTLYVTREFLQKRYPTSGVTSSVSNVEIPDSSTHLLQNRIDRIRNKKEILTIGLIGYLSTNLKGIDTALKAISIIKDKLPEFEFRVLGSGDTDKWIKMAKDLCVEKTTKFYKPLPSGEKVLNWLDDIDIYLQPSRQEGLPRALIEAMSRGCTAFGSSAGGIPELLEKECIIKPGDSNKLSRLILDSAFNVENRVRYAKINYEESQRYVNYRLEAKRTQFWMNFCKEAQSAGGGSFGK